MSALSLLPVAEQRRAVVAAARSWVGTPYHHEGDIKGVGVDCAMLLVRIFCDLGLVAPFDPRPYPADWYLHRGEERYLRHLLARAAEIALPPEPGDVAIWRVGRCFAHGAIVTAWPQVVHAYAQERVVDESDVSLPGPHSDPCRPIRFFSLWSAEPTAAASSAILREAA